MLTGLSVSLFPATPPPLQTKNSIKAIKMVMLGMNGAHPPSSSSCTNSADFFPLHVRGGEQPPPFSLKMEASTTKLREEEEERKKERKYTHSNTTTRIQIQDLDQKLDS